MLVVARKKDQTIKIGDDITVCVVDVRGAIVKLGIDAPKEISVVRDDAKPRKVIKSAKEPKMIYLVREYGDRSSCVLAAFQNEELASAYIDIRMHVLAKEFDGTKDECEDWYDHSVQRIRLLD